MTRGRPVVLPPSRNIAAIGIALRMGALPRAGGINDQDDDFVEDLEAIDSELKKRERELWSKKK